MESAQFVVIDKIVTGRQLLEHVPEEHRETIQHALVEAMREVPVEPLFSDADRDILRCLADDLTIAQIAHRFGRAESTIEGRIRQMKDKLGCRGLAGLVAIAFRRKIIE